MSENGAVLTATDNNFASRIEQAEGLAVVDFWAEWCGPGRLVGPISVERAEEYAGRVTCAKLDVDANEQTAARYNIRSIPSILFFKCGELVETVVGAVPKGHLERKIQEHLG